MPSRTTIAALFAAAAAWTACVGENPDLRGDQAQPDPNRPEGGSSDGGGPPVDAAPGADSAAPDAASDGGTPAWFPCPVDMPSASTVACPKASPACAPNDSCCIGSGTSTCRPEGTFCSSKEKALRCNGASTCSDGIIANVCCLTTTADLRAGSTCPPTLSEAEFVETSCSGACGTKQLVVCRNDGECAAGKCRAVTFASSVGAISLGVCM